MINIKTPLSDADVEKLKAGDQVLITGAILTGRDSAHKRLIELLDKGEPLPVDIEGQIIYYVGPSPARPGRPIGSAGPTTSMRMDAYAPKLLQQGLKGMIGKGPRNQAVKDAMVEHKGLYFAAVGGAAALISRSIKSAEVLAYEDLGPEAIRKLTVENFPAVVINDCHGGDLYLQGIAKYREIAL